ncbi:MAG: hypothetical protein JKX94_06495 [Sneathiella sp.]|nr:hypothetical protein [Sneathiella sp.]
MIFSFRIVLILSLFLLSSCVSSIPINELKFDSNNKKGLVAFPNLKSTQINSFILFHIDLSKQTIIGKPITSCSGCYIGDQYFEFNQKKYGKFVLLEPGTYFLKGYTNEIVAGYRYSHIQYCLSVMPFDVKPGMVNIVTYPFTNQVAFKEKLKYLPGISAPIIETKPTSLFKKAGWKKTAFTKDCGFRNGEKLEFVRTLN